MFNPTTGTVITVAGDPYYNLATKNFATLYNNGAGTAIGKYADGVGTNAGLSGLDGVWYDGYSNSLYVSSRRNRN